MKLTVVLFSVLAPLTALSVMAQTNSVPPPSVPPAPVAMAPAAEPAATTATAAPTPAAAPHAKAKAKHHHLPLVKSSVFLDPPVTATVKNEVLNIRGQPSFNGEVIGHVKRGETVTVLEELTLSRTHKDEPANWARISLPTNAAVWVDGDYIKSDTKEVRVKRVNIRGGPGENYSIIGRLDKGTVVTEIRKDKGWLKIETPTNAFAFVAAEFLEMQAATNATPSSPPAPVVASTPPPAPTPTEVSVPAPTATVPASAEPVAQTTPAEPMAPAPTASSQADQELAALRRATAPEAMVTNAPPPVETAAPTEPRIVTREGMVHRSYNIQAPADYELHDIQTGDLIDYLQPPAHQKFKIYVGTRVTVTGEEVLDERWPRTPVLEVQSIDLHP